MWLFLHVNELCAIRVGDVTQTNKKQKKVKKEKIWGEGEVKQERKRVELQNIVTKLYYIKK